MITNKMKTILTTLGILLIATLALSINKPESPAVESVIVEESIEVEEWMTEPFCDTMEEPLELEEWMTKPFNI